MSYFTKDEFACKCGCGKKDMDAEHMRMLIKAREVARVPFVINSGCRCEKHNAAVGSTSRNHIEGKASDIACTDGWTRLVIIKALLYAGFKRIGISKTFIHADNMPLNASIWVY